MMMMTMMMMMMTMPLTSTVSLVAVVRHPAVLVTVTHELLDDTSTVVALKVPVVLAVRSCNHNHDHVLSRPHQQTTG